MIDGLSLAKTAGLIAEESLTTAILDAGSVGDNLKGILVKGH